MEEMQIILEQSQYEPLPPNAAQITLKKRTGIPASPYNYNLKRNSRSFHKEFPST
jgi:hypothetical protein